MDTRSGGCGGGRRDAEGGGEGEEAVEGGEGGATQEEAAEGGAAVETAWAPQDTEELLDAIATQDYGVCCPPSVRGPQ